MALFGIDQRNIGSDANATVMRDNCLPKGYIRELSPVVGGRGNEERGCTSTYVQIDQLASALDTGGNSFMYGCGYFGTQPR